MSSGRDYWEQVTAAKTEFLSLLDDASSEIELQRYLERHPWLLMCDDQIPVVISQFPLGADYKCDFAFRSSCSSSDRLYLIEIESPLLSIFTSGNEFTSDFNHAIQQLEDWSNWWYRNHDYVLHLLEPVADIIGKDFFPTWRRVRLELLLVAGRRNQINNIRRMERWEEKIERLPRNTSLRTYDGFIESLPMLFKRGAHEPLCCRYSARSFSVLSGALSCRKS